MKRKLNAVDVLEPTPSPSPSAESGSGSLPPEKRCKPSPAAPQTASTSARTAPAAKASQSNANASAKEAVSFATLSLDARLQSSIQAQKFAQPTLVQREAIPAILRGEDVLARARTGSGKTLAYLLPSLHSILHSKANRTAKSSKFTQALILVPTNELAAQVCSVLKTFTSNSGGLIRYENISRKEDIAVTRARLREQPDVVVCTPARASQFTQSNALDASELKFLVIDEADLVLSYGYEDDLQNLAAALPTTGYQTVLMSATLEIGTMKLSELFCRSNHPTLLDLSAQEAQESRKLVQYFIATPEEDKWLLLYALFKLQLLKAEDEKRAKSIVFVADTDRAYRVKLFLEQFGVRSCVLNSELPVNSRVHVVDEFNKGMYDIIIAADDGEVIDGGHEGAGRKRKNGGEDAYAGAEEKGRDLGVEPAQEVAAADLASGTSPPPSMAPATRSKPPQKPDRKDKEFTLSRGLDFRLVTHVLNFDLPTTAISYTHRIGRTARAGQTGMALSFVVPREKYRSHPPTSIQQSQHDEEVLEKIQRKQANSGGAILKWEFDMGKLEGFRYRLGDALRSVTRIAIREARVRELRQALVASEKLKRHFEEHPEELRHLRADGETHAIRAQGHLRHVPEYLLPSGGKAGLAQDVGKFGLRKRDGESNALRRRRAVNKARGKGRLGKGKGLDPLKSLNVRGRGKK